MSFFDSIKHTMWLQVTTCAFTFLQLTSFAAELAICPDCGREGDIAYGKCKVCDVPFASSEKEEETVAERKKPQITDALKAAAEDVKKAQKEENDDIASAIIIYRNAQALLVSESGKEFEAAAAKKIGASLNKITEIFEEDYNSQTRNAMLIKAERKAEDYFRSVGRIPCGRVWVPSDWPELLGPHAIANIRHAIQPACPGCGGLGREPCKKCRGSAREVCKYKNCKDGWIIVKNQNKLATNTDLVKRKKCPLCKGTAIVRCESCNGNGGVACKKCQGTGLAPLCKSCSGSGLLPCKPCSKDGVRPNCVLCKGESQTLCTKCGGDGRAGK